MGTRVEEAGKAFFRELFEEAKPALVRRAARHVRKIQKANEVLETVQAASTGVSVVVNGLQQIFDGAIKFTKPKP